MHSSILAVALASLAASSLLACGTEDRTTVNLDPDSAPSQLADGDTPSDISDTLNDLSDVPAEIDGVATDTPMDIDEFFEDDSEGSTAGDVVAPAPDVTPDVPVLVPENCPTLSVSCSTRNGEIFVSGGTRLVTDFDNAITCTGSGAQSEQMPTEVRWEYSYPELDQTNSEVVGALTTMHRPFSVSPGPYELRYAVDFPGLSCTSAPIRINYEAPDGFYVELSWDDGLVQQVGDVSVTDVDTHLVRNGACMKDPESSLYYGTIEAELDWGVEGVTNDDPTYVYDYTRSPGVETAWIPEPASGEVVHYVTHGFRLDERLAGAPVEVTYRVFIDGVKVQEGQVSVGLDEYVALGAFNDGDWVDSFLNASSLCPALSDR
jgi:hypothetical protein